MFGWLLENSSVQVVKQVKTISLRARDTVKTRVSTFLFLTACYLHMGEQTAALCFMAGLCVTEIIIAHTARRVLDSPKDLRRIDVVLFGAVELLSSVFFVALGLFAATSPSPSIAIMGLLWIIGILNYTSINFARWRYFNILNIAPAGLGLIAFAAISGSAPLRAATTIEIGMAVVGALFLLFTTFELIIDQRKIEQALEIARQDAADRLEALEHIASRDDLTGLMNRSAVNDRLTQLLKTSRAENRPFSFLLMDLDGFKPINDGFGHPAGDAILVEISARLINTVGSQGFVARVGGDEFAVVLTKITDPDLLEDMARDLIRVVGLPVPFADTELSVGVSVGAAICKDQLDTLEKISAAADEALYKAKENKKSSVVLFHPEIVRKRISIEERNSIEAAIKNRQIKPHYQPKFCLKTFNVIGFEALARWPLDPTKPSQSADFIPKIKDMGMIGEFTYHMARQVFSDIGTLIDEGYDPGQVSLNLSEVTLATMNGLEDLQWLLAENAKVVPFVTMEITEDVFIARSGARIRESIKELRSIGVRISLDDFGTGFASFQHLRQLDFDELKIDTEFVRGLGIDPAANVIVEGFLSIARGLGVSVVAEGVETEAQRNYLLERGCPAAQGFLHSKAQPLEDIRKYLAAPDKKASA